MKFGAFVLAAELVAATVFAENFVVGGKSGTAIQKAIDEAAAAGGGRVVVPEGDYPSGSLRLASHVELHLEKGALVKGSAKGEDYFDFPLEICSVAPENSRKVFVYAWDAEDVAITGEGTIDGQGPEFFDRTELAKGARFWSKPPHPRPRMVQFVRCRNVRLSGVTFKDAPGWAMLIRLCENVSVKGITVDSEQRMINSDGIDFDGCRRVRVFDSCFKTGDDCLVLRAMREDNSKEWIVCEDVIVSNCTLNSACQTIRMGCPSDDTIRNVVFKDIAAVGYNGIFFDYPARYLRSDDDGFMDISDVLFENYRGEFGNSAVQIVAAPGVKLRGVRDITFRHFNVKSAQPLRFIGNFDSPVKNVTLEDVVADVAGGQPYEAKATEPLRFVNCVFNGKKVPDRDLVTERGERQPLIRASGVSWESAKQKR